MSRVAACLVLLAALAGCGSGKREAASLVAAVDRYREADMRAKGPLAGAIEVVPCADPEVCSAKEACLAAARPTVKGVALKAEVEAALGDLHAGRITQEAAASRGLPQKLEEAQRQLDEGRGKLSGCDAEIMALRRKYGI